MLKESAVVMSYDAETGLAKVNVNHKAPAGLVRLEKPVEQLPCLNSMETRRTYLHVRNHHATAHRSNGGDRSRRKSMLFLHC